MRLEEQELQTLFAANRRLFKAYVLREQLDRLWMYKMAITCERQRRIGARSASVSTPGGVHHQLVTLEPSLQQRLVKTGGRLVKHARYYWLLAGSHLTRRLFEAMQQRIWALPVPTG